MVGRMPNCGRGKENGLLPQMKTCGHCKLPRKVGDFYRNKGKPGGRSRTCRFCQEEYCKSWRRRHPKKSCEIRRRSRIKHAYGLSGGEFDRLLTRQSNQCAVCKSPLTKPCVDHDHRTGKVRGLVCRDCNLAVGHFKDDPERMRKAIRYLQKHGR